MKMRYIDGVLMLAAGIGAAIFGAADGSPLGVFVGIVMVAYAAYIGLGSGGYVMPTILYVIAGLGILAGIVSLFGGA